MNQSPEDAVHAYARAFATLDRDAVVPFYRLPCMFVTPESATVVSNQDMARGLVTALMQHARSVGYVRTEVEDLEVRRLADNLALANGVYVRYNARDEEVVRFGFAYVMHDHGDGWKFSVAVAFDASRNGA